MVFRSFRLHCRRASFLFVFRLGCATLAEFPRTPLAFTLRRGSFLSLFQLGCATVVVQLPCFRTCVSSGLQICSAGGYFFLFFLGSVGNVSPVFCLRFRSDFGPFWAWI